MTNENGKEYSLYELCSLAYERNEFDLLFLGQSDYKIDNLKHIPADVPTDIGGIVDNGLYVLYDNGHSDIPNKLIDTIIKLLEGDALSIWTAFFITRYQYRNELTNKAKFKIIDSTIVNKVSKSVKDNKDKLIDYNLFIGASYSDGLWGDISRLDALMLQKYGVSIL